MTDPRTFAPEPTGDIVAGDIPVPVTVWHVPAPADGETLSPQLAQRLVANFTHPRRAVIDVTAGDQLTRATQAARRVHHRHQHDDLQAGTGRAQLAVVAWPAAVVARSLFTDCAYRLARGGCLAVVLQPGALSVNQDLIAAAAASGLRYLQHIVAAHDLAVPPAPPTGRHVRAHRDVLVFARPQPAAGRG